MPIRSLAAAIVLLMPICTLAAPTQVTISAGKSDRDHAIVQFHLEPSSAALLDPAGRELPLTISPAGDATVILPHLAARQSIVLRLQDLKIREKDPAIQAVRNKSTEQVIFQANHKPILQYDGKATPLPAGYKPQYQRGGYIHPVWTPDGKVITDDYPSNHRHHHGIWAPWTKTQFEGRHPDFWNMGDGTGRVEFVELVNAFSGDACAGLETRHRFVDLSAKPAPKTALNESWHILAYAPPSSGKPYYAFDLIIDQSCASDSPLILPQYYYGGLGFRGPMAWNGKGAACTFITSEGKTRADGNESRCRWCFIGGQLDGQMRGVTILSDPANFRFPQPARLNPTEPFFCFAPSQLGDWQITPEKPYHARYRFIVTDGELDKSLIERLWTDFATPPEVLVR